MNKANLMPTSFFQLFVLLLLGCSDESLHRSFFCSSYLLESILDMQEDFFNFGVIINEFNSLNAQLLVAKEQLKKASGVHWSNLNRHIQGLDVAIRRMDHEMQMIREFYGY